MTDNTGTAQAKSFNVKGRLSYKPTREIDKQLPSNTQGYENLMMTIDPAYQKLSEYAKDKAKMCIQIVYDLSLIDEAEKVGGIKEFLKLCDNERDILFLENIKDKNTEELKAYSRNLENTLVNFQ